MGTFRGRKPGTPSSVGSVDESDLGRFEKSGLKMEVYSHKKNQQKKKKKRFLKVKMPDGTHTTVQLQETALVSELLEKCCSKRKFDPDQFHLEFIEGLPF